MSDIQALQASVGADVAQFLAAMQQSSAAMMQMMQAQQAASAAAREVATTTAQSEAATKAATTAARALASAERDRQSAMAKANAEAAEEAKRADGYAHGYMRQKEAEQEATKATRDAAAAQGQAGSATSATASQIGLSVVTWQMVVTAVRRAADELVALGQASVAAATQLDPSAALALDAASDKLGDGIGALESRIGKALLPTLLKFDETVGGVAQKLAHMDWGGYAKQAAPALNALLDGFKTFGSTVADYLTAPLRLFVATLESAAATVLQTLGEATSKLGGTSIGKKLGLSEFSGDALKKTGDDMQAQSVRIASSFGAAWKEVADGAKVTIGAALDLVDQKTGGLVTRMKTDYAKASDTGPSRQSDDLAAQRQSMAANLAFENQIAAQKDQESQMEITAQRTIARERKAALMAEGQQADQIFQQALQQLQQDRSNGNLGAIAADQKAVFDAAHASQAAYTAAVKESQDALNKAIDTAADLNGAYDHQIEVARKAKDAANAAHELAVSGSNNEKLKDAEVIANAAYQRDQQHLASLNSQKNAAEQEIIQLQTMADNESSAAKIRTQHEIDQMRKESDKAAASFYSATFKNLGRAGLGSVGSSVLDAGMQGGAAAGPAGAAIGAGAALLQNSAGFKAVGDAISGVLQQVADAVGQLFLPLVPVIKEIGEAIGPLIKMLGDVFGVIGRMVAAVLRPLLPVIKVFAEVIAAVIEPIALIATLITELEIAFDPFIIVLRVLSPILNKVAGILKTFVEGVAKVWNFILHALEKVFDILAHALPGDAGDAMRSVFDGLVAMEIPVDELQSSTSQAASAMRDLTLAQQAYLNSLQQGITDSQTLPQKISDLKDAIAQAQAEGASKDVITALQAQLAQAESQNNVAQDLAQASAHSAFGDTADAVRSYYLQSLIDAASGNTSATTGLTKSVNDLNATMTNAPSGFRLATYEGIAAATGGGGLSVGGAKPLPSPGTPMGMAGSGASKFENCTFIIQTNDPDKMSAAIEKAARKGTYKKGLGLVPASGGGFGG